MREQHFKTIIKFIWDLRPKIRRAMITISYDLNIVEEAFYVALNIDSSFNMLINAKTRCSKCEKYEYYGYQCPSDSQHVRTVPTDDIDDSNVIKDVHVPSKTASIIKDIVVDSDTPIIDEVHMSSDSTSDDLDEIVKSNTQTMPSKLFEFPFAEYNFMIGPMIIL